MRAQRVDALVMEVPLSLTVNTADSSLLLPYKTSNVSALPRFITPNWDLDLRSRGLAREESTHARIRLRGNYHREKVEPVGSARINREFRSVARGNITRKHEECASEDSACVCADRSVQGT
jgi:hypothetical protein